MNEVFLCLGGNLGNRLNNLFEARKAIEAWIGSIEKKSSVYQTQAWQSTSQNHFLNQIVKVKTNLSANEILTQIKKIENSLGRKRNNNRNSDRTVDIDILFFNAEIIKTKNLEVPHPRLHLRNFVLELMFEIEKNKVHPKLKKSILELKTNCKDKLWVKKIKSQKPFLICVEGNIGVGKTTLAKTLSQHLNFNFVGEEFDNNLLLPLFYRDKEDYSTALEYSFLLSRFHQMKKTSEETNLNFVADFSYYKSLWFAKANLDKQGFIEFEKTFLSLNSKIVKPNLIIYLHSSNTNLISNIKQRGRKYEAKINSNYLAAVEIAYQQGISNLNQIKCLHFEIREYNKTSEQNILNIIHNYLKENFGKQVQKL